jgi:hypothetical protein
VGNSFAWNSIEFVPQLAQSAGRKITIFPANLSNCSLEQHVQYLEAFEANASDPAGRPYIDFNSPDHRKISLPEILQSDKWDYVTIQQASGLSFQPESYTPYAGKLIGYIHKYAPQARILVLETWAYRQDHPMFAQGTLDQEKMYQGLHSAYYGLANQFGLRLVPIGDAFQLARHDPQWTFVFPDPHFNYQTPPPGALPDQQGSLNVGWSWTTDSATGHQKLELDAKHCNTTGKYLASATLYETLFGDDVRPNAFVPPGIDPAAATRLRDIAHQAVTQADKSISVPETTGLHAGTAQ